MSSTELEQLLVAAELAVDVCTTATSPGDVEHARNSIANAQKEAVDLEAQLARERAAMPDYTPEERRPEVEAAFAPIDEQLQEARRRIEAMETTLNNLNR